MGIHTSDEFATIEAKKKACKRLLKKLPDFIPGAFAAISAWNKVMGDDYHRYKNHTELLDHAKELIKHLSEEDNLLDECIVASGGLQASWANAECYEIAISVCLDTSIFIDKKEEKE